MTDKIIKKITKTRKAIASEKELLAFDFSLSMVNYGMTQRTLAKEALSLDPVNASVLLNGDKKELATYRRYNDRLTEYLENN